MGLVYLHFVQEQLQQPTPDWSRALQIGDTAEGTDIEVVASNTDYKLYIPSNSGLTELTLDKDLEQVGKKDISATVPDRGDFWVGQEGKVVYKREGNLYLFSNGKESVIQEDIKGLSTQQNKIVFWNEKEVFELSLKDFTVSSLVKMNHKIEIVQLGENSDSFLISYEPREKILAVDLYYLNKQNTYDIIPLLEMLNSRTTLYAGASFYEQDAKIHMAYSTLSLASGNRTFTSYYGEIDPAKAGEKPGFEMITLKADGTGNFLTQEQDIKLINQDGPKIWFITKSEVTRGKTGLNIFVAHPGKEKGTWLANPRSRTFDVSHVPFYFGEGMIIWKDFDARDNDDNILTASTDPDIIERASEATKKDLISAASNTVVSYTGGFLIVILFGLLWFALPAIILFFLPENVSEEKPKLTTFGIMGLFVIIQMICNNWMLGAGFDYYAPAYLTFPGASIVVTLVFAFISWFTTRIAKNSDWSHIKEVSYFMVVSTLLFMFVVGPYIL